MSTIKITIGNDLKKIDIYSDEGFRLIAELWTKTSFQHRLMYEPSWLGIPIIQYPNDIIVMQELIWKIKPDVIIETGIAHGGSAILYASILELLGKGRVIAIDIDIRLHNKAAIKNHPLSERIDLVEGSSVDEKIVKKIKAMIKRGEKVLVVLDSDHSADHVRREIKYYSPLVTTDSYMVVMDGVQEKLWDVPSGKEEWRYDNPLVAIKEFLQQNQRQWQVDYYYNRLCVTANHSGFLKRLNT